MPDDYAWSTNTTHPTTSSTTTTTATTSFPVNSSTAPTVPFVDDDVSDSQNSHFAKPYLFESLVVLSMLLFAALTVRHAVMLYRKSKMRTSYQQI